MDEGELPEAVRHAYGLGETPEPTGDVPVGGPPAAGAIDDQVFEPTPAWTSRALARRVAGAGAYAFALIGIVFVSSGFRFDGVAPAFWVLILALGGIGILVALRADGVQRLTVTSQDVTLEEVGFRLEVGWERVERVVRIGSRSSAIALELAPGAVAWELPKRAQPWRRRPYRYDRTIPLEPFTAGDPDAAVLTAIWTAAPRLLAQAPENRLPVRQPWSTRVLAASAVVVPYVALVLALDTWGHRDDGPGRLFWTLSWDILFIGGLLATSAFGWCEATGERIVDAIGRLLARPGPGEQRMDALRMAQVVWVRYAFLLLVVVVSSVLPSAGSTTSLEAEHGPAHACWYGDDKVVVGCVLADGTMSGERTSTPVTCFFHEPLAPSARMTCRRE